MTSPIHKHNSLRWTWQPIPPGEDNHSEYACQNEILPNGFRIIAARVRGKRHKHDGTNCDDWFEIAHSGEWNIIAVADGAGSKMFSRVGARVACKGAVNYLVKQLRHHQIVSRQTWSADTFARNKTCHFTAPDIEFTQQVLHEAIQAAYHAIEEAYYVRDDLKYYYKALGNRDLAFEDFATTLLLAVHTSVEYQAAPYNLILTCQVGDGMFATICKRKTFTCLLGEVEPECFNGETHFLTSSNRKLARDYLATKTFPFFSQMQALMVMTDGVADDYYPPDKGMLWLFGDLILNGIIPVTTSKQVPSETINLLTQNQNDYVKMEERVTKQGRHLVPICSVSDYAKILNLSIKELISTPEWLVAGIPSEILANNNLTQECRLQTWLDTYHVRGSFDDRTLVVLF